MHGAHPPEEGLGLVANRSLSQVNRFSQHPPQPQQQQQVQMAGRPPSPNPHYSPQQFAATASPAATSMMMAQQQQQQRPVGQMQQQQRPTGIAPGSQIRGVPYLQQAQQFTQTPYVHHMGSVPMNNVNQARPGVQGSIASAGGATHYGSMQNLGVAQQHNMQARQKPNQGQASPSHYIGAMQQQSLVPSRQSVALTAQQQQQQQQQALQQQSLSAQQRLVSQQQVLVRQAQSQPMMQNPGNLAHVRPSSGAQMQGNSTGSQPSMYVVGKPVQYQQQPQPQQPARPQMVSASMATSQARPGTPGAGAPSNHALPSSAAPAAPSEPLDATGSILGKRSIQDLLGQVDPNERLDPDVEEVLLEVADDFIETVTAFAVKLAKHRKSDVLEAKDVLLHLDKQWNITVPGFGGDEYRSYKRPSVSETHKQRLSVVRKSAAAGQAAAESKAISAAAAAPATTLATPVKSGLAGLGTGSPSGSPGIPRLPRV